MVFSHFNDINTLLWPISSYQCDVPLHGVGKDAHNACWYLVKADSSISLPIGHSSSADHWLQTNYIRPPPYLKGQEFI